MDVITTLVRRQLGFALRVPGALFALVSSCLAEFSSLSVGRLALMMV